MSSLVFAILIGIGATVIMDIWALLRERLFGIAPTNWGMVGRWVAHMKKGRFHHFAIASATPVRGEQTIGWLTHYLTGIVYAILLVWLSGPSWIMNPSIGPALGVGIITVLAPFFILQPALGAGIAASKTQNPNSVRFHSVVNHAVFGLGLFLSAVILTKLYS